MRVALAAHRGDVAAVTPYAIQYDAPWLYGLAAATNLARIGSREHWASDGRRVLRRCARQPRLGCAPRREKAGVEGGMCARPCFA